MRHEASIDELESWEHLDRGDALHVAVAVAIFTVADGQLQVLMSENPKGPFQNHFVLPQRILQSHELLDAAARDIFFGIVKATGEPFSRSVRAHSRDAAGRLCSRFS